MSCPETLVDRGAEAPDLATPGWSGSGVPEPVVIETAPRAALYGRVSTTDQHEESQAHELEEYAKARRLDVVGVYRDNGVSGSATSRPGLDRLLADAKRARFDVLVVTKLDRLGRSLHHLLAVLGELEALGIDFVSLDDGLDTRTPVGRFFLQIRGAFAEYEGALIRERTRAGIRAARRRGSAIGRPKALDDQTVARAKRLRKTGNSIRQIAKVLGASRSAVHRAVR